MADNRNLRPRVKRYARQPCFVYAAGHLRRAVMYLRRMPEMGRYQRRARKLQVLADALECFLPEIEKMAGE